MGFLRGAGALIAAVVRVILRSLARVLAFAFVLVRGGFFHKFIVPLARVLVFAFASPALLVIGETGELGRHVILNATWASGSMDLYQLQKSSKNTNQMSR
jgi:hypothetical protein